MIQIYQVAGHEL